MGSQRLLSALSWTYMAGYLAYVIVAGIKTWPTMTWSAWWSDLALQAAWDAAFWPYYFPGSLAFGSQLLDPTRQSASHDAQSATQTKSPRAPKALPLER